MLNQNTNKTLQMSLQTMRKKIIKVLSTMRGSSLVYFKLDQETFFTSYLHNYQPQTSPEFRRTRQIERLNSN